MSVSYIKILNKKICISFLIKINLLKPQSNQDPCINWRSNNGKVSFFVTLPLSEELCSELKRGQEKNHGRLCSQWSSFRQ